ncbi:hypothetical protein QJS10_CPB22g00123 [Acorus calamus]|uniref:FAD dependent oxidoreductase domain-containing protein n=1 Tax=Acorus calamus TaxID=4465 RepID=A0AAV9BZY0_ACOCL|nr:hypothetical protein QJS10_CPB22g00123 [Acorus calamus]
MESDQQHHQEKEKKKRVVQRHQEKEKKKMVVVCGGGVVGACTAFYLSKSGGADVTVVEKSSVACAASGKAGGFLALDWCDGGPVSALARASFALHRSLADELDGPTSYGYRPLQTLSLSISADDVRPNDRGPIPGWVDGPARSPRTIGTVETTAQVHPQLFTRALLSSAVDRHGARLVIGKVESVEVDDATGRATGVSVVRGGEVEVIQADAVVLALGPWSCRFPVISSLLRVSAIKAHSIVVRPREPSAITAHALFLAYHPKGRKPGSKSLDPEVYPRPTGDVYICGMSSETEVPDDPEEITGDPDSIEMLHEIAGTVSSHLSKDRGGAEVRAEQACFLPCTDDSVPVIGEIPGLQGPQLLVLNSPATGAALAELIMDGHASIVDLKPFSPSRFLPGSRPRLY